MHIEEEHRHPYSNHQNPLGHILPLQKVQDVVAGKQDLVKKTYNMNSNDLYISENF